MSFALVFPGQGSQSVGMMKGYEGLPEIRETYAEASDSLGQDLWKLVTEGPVEDINATVNTQPVMLTAGVAVYRAWRKQGGAEPALMAGHSLGEFTALVAAGALAFSDAVSLVRFRAQAMQSAVAEGVGGMAAILGMDEVAVHALCSDAAQGQVLEAVNLNSPGQIVIAGHKSAVERAMILAKERGAKRALSLPVSVPSHCALMRPAGAVLATHLQNVEIAVPKIPVIQNADVQSHGEAAAIKDALVRQLYSPVRWIETIQFMAGQGVSIVAECGPGKVLAGLNKRCDERVQQALAFNDRAALEAALEQLR